MIKIITAVGTFYLKQNIEVTEDNIEEVTDAFDKMAVGTALLTDGSYIILNNDIPYIVQVSVDTCEVEME